MPSNQFYEEEDAQQILKLAATKQGSHGPLSRETLVQTAAELGISPEAVEAAEREYFQSKTLDDEMSEFKRARVHSFLSDLATFAVVGGFVIALTHGHGVWLWLIAIWGLSVARKGVRAFSHTSRSFRASFEEWRVTKRVPGEAEGSVRREVRIDSKRH